MDIGWIGSSDDSPYMDVNRNNSVSLRFRILLVPGTKQNS